MTRIKLTFVATIPAPKDAIALAEIINKLNGEALDLGRELETAYGQAAYFEHRVTLGRAGKAKPAALDEPGPDRPLQPVAGATDLLHIPPMLRRT